MFQDLRSKLEMYKGMQVKKTETCRVVGRDIQDILAGTLTTTEHGPCFYIENTYPLFYLHGRYPLGSVLAMDFPLLLRSLNEQPEEMTLREVLFLDTETTGLSGGTGTVAFLIGAGYFTQDAFVLRQYFMRDYHEEPAVLSELNRVLSGRKGIVSYNGKTFDWNLLQTRFTFNRIRPAIREPVHIDLLFPARRIWRDTLENCKLSSIETNLLGEHRTDDIPGAMIPSIFFQYLEARDAGEIQKVIRHNEKDILSLVTLTAKILSLLKNPLDESKDEQELFGMGRMFEKSGAYEQGIRCYKSCLQSAHFPVKDSAAKKLGAIYKRSKDYSSAVAHWESMLSASEVLNLYPVIELAKHYEHREKNIQRALDIVEKAMAQCLQIGLHQTVQHAELVKRQERLRRKKRKAQKQGEP